MLKQLLIIPAFLATVSLWASSVCAAPKPQSLLDIYNLALQHDQNLASALSANQAAQELIEQGKALYRPSVSFNASTNASRINIHYQGNNLPFPSGSRSYEGYQYGFEARQPLFRMQNLVQMQQLHTQVNQADKQLHLSQQNLLLRSTENYFAVLLAQDKLNLILAQKAAIVRQLDEAKSRFDVGSATITDANEAQARYDLIVAQEIAQQAAVEIAKRTVQEMTGEPLQTLAKVKANLTPNTLSQNLNQWLEVAADNNLNIQIQQDMAKYAEQEIDRNQAEHLPTLDAVANYTETYANGSSYGFGSDLSSGVIGVQLQVPLYQGGATSSRVRQASINKQKALDDVSQARRHTELETQRAYLNLTTSIAQVAAYSQALVSSQSQLDSTHISYGAGIRTSVEYLNAQQQLFSAKRDLLEARYQYLMNIVRLKNIAGIINEEDIADINQQLEVEVAAE
ncbi:TolC family outer membrane protein [Methylomonas sp. AM2-LC]|uniref:TolC family outer membrane protein n=1 Tax=Methylomonas sp. AM2-LC TaxID=3153301 RepID=UPI003263AA66